MGIVEAGSDVFYINTSDPFTAHKSYLHRLNLRHWYPGEPVRAETVLEFPAQAGGLNGSCLLAPGVIVLTDSLAGLIWQVDLDLARISGSGALYGELSPSVTAVGQPAGLCW